MTTGDSGQNPQGGSTSDLSTDSQQAGVASSTAQPGSPAPQGLTLTDREMSKIMKQYAKEGKIAVDTSTWTKTEDKSKLRGEVTAIEVVISATLDGKASRIVASYDPKASLIHVSAIGNAGVQTHEQGHANLNRMIAAVGNYLIARAARRREDPAATANAFMNLIEDPLRGNKSGLESIHLWYDAETSHGVNQTAQKRFESPTTLGKFAVGAWNDLVSSTKKRSEGG